MEVKRYICDRCKKELGNKRGYQIYRYYQYNLCDDCTDDLVELKKKISVLNDECEMLEKKYKFGDYLPDEKDLGGDE